MRTKQLLTNSRMTTSKTCLRKAFLKYELSLVPDRESQPLRMGSALHVGLDCRAKGASAEEAILRATTGYLLVPQWADPVEWELERVIVSRLLHGYYWRYAEDDLEIVASEIGFRLPIVNPESGWPSKTFEAAGVIDKIVRLQDGRLALMEHKCVHGESRIFDYETGKLWRVSDLADQHISPLVLSFKNGKLVKARAGIPEKESVRPTYTIRTSSGRIVRTSGNHPFLTKRGWIRADQITSDDFVALPATTSGWSGDSPLSTDEAKFVAYMLGDGTFSSMRFTKTDQTIRDDYCRVLDNLGCPYKHVYLKGKRTTSIRTSMATAGRYRGFVSPAMKLVKRLRMSGRADAKRIPDEVFSLRDDQIASFIGAIWSTDGSVSVFKESKRDRTYDKIDIRYVSRSRVLCDGLQRLLLRIGIWATINESSVLYKGERRAVFTLRVSGRGHKRTFLEGAVSGQIPFLKYPDLVKQALGLIKSGNHRDDVVPDGDIFWDEVRSVSVGESAMMYDITVPGTNNFVVDDVITHNTTSDDISSGSDYWDRLKIDQQISLYVLAARQLGYDVQTVLYDVIKKPGIRPKKVTKDGAREIHFKKTYCGEKIDPAQLSTDTETPEMFGSRLTSDIGERPQHYYQRREISRLEADLEEFKYELWSQAKLTRECQLSGHWFRNTNACIHPYKCEFVNICFSGCDPTKEVPLGYRKTEDIHPELNRDGIKLNGAALRQAACEAACT